MEKAGPLALAVLGAILAAGCASPAPANVLVDPSFEERSEAWTWLDGSNSWQGPFEIVEGKAHEGSRALATHVTPDASRDLSIRGAVQNLTAAQVGGAVPERLSGHVLVETWQPGSAKTYYQVVIAATPAAGASACARIGRAPCQLAYVLGGIDAPPFPIANRKFLFVGEKDPVVGEWQAFEVHPRADFEREWGEAPSFDQLRIYLEARSEYAASEPIAERVPVEARVLWDDLTLGR